jgi:Raf kinase inhibitor-like YbhB/YbcL family protein
MISKSKRFGRNFARRVSALAICALGTCFAAARSAAAQQSSATPAPRPNVAPPLKITIPRFPDGGRIPLQYTCAATTPPPTGPMHISLGVTPQIQWANVPKGTASFVLILHDGDAHIGKAFVDIAHWVVFNIPGDATGLPEGIPPDAPLPNGTMQGDNMMRRAAFQGPCAPPGGAAHHYIFELYALDTKLDLPQGAPRADVEKAMDGHVVGAAVYFGLFTR